MHFDCVIAVYEDYQKAASAISSLQQEGISDQIVSLVTHDVGGEIPDPDPVESGNQITVLRQTPEGVAKSLPPTTKTDSEHGTLSELGTILKLTASEFFTKLFSRFGESREIARSIADYQHLVSNHHLLVVVTGKIAEVEHAARILADTRAVQVNIHYVGGLKKT